jgi:hypothetical protein
MSVDNDGNITEGNLHIYKGVNRRIEVVNRPCPNCGSLTYLGVFIPTVTVLYADYYSPSFQCHNLICDPIHEDYTDFEGGKVLKDYGAYWSAEDKYYYTPQNPRL